VRLINTGHEEAKEKENKEEKRVINKKGREAPRMDGADDDDIIEENPKAVPAKKDKKEKKEYGFSSKNEDD
jgi:hypothetical protein